MANEIKFNQKDLSGIEQNFKSVRLSDIIQELVSKHGLAALEIELKIDKSALSRFKNGDGALCLQDIEKLLEFAEVALISRRRYWRLIETIITMSEFLKESLGW